MGNIDFTTDRQYKPKDILQSTIVGYGSSNNYKIDDKDQIEEVDKLYNKKNFPKAIVTLSDLITRNPYMPDYYYKRALCYKYINDSISVHNDFNMIANFLKLGNYKSLADSLNLPLQKD